MEEVIDKLREVNEPVPVPLELPTFEQLVEAQEAMLIGIPDDFRDFLMEVSDVVYGTLEPATLADSSSHTYLPEMAARAWDLGLDRDLLPVCEFGEQMYVINTEGEVSLWPDNGESPWPNIWHWARDVWLDGAL